MMVYRHSEETKRKIGKSNSISLLGNTPWNKGLTKDNNKSLKRISIERTGKGNPVYGKKVKQETIDKRRLKIVGHEVSKETRDKIRKSNLGRIITKEWRRKISLGSVGRTPWNKGKKMSQESRNKMSISQKKRFIEHPMIRGRIRSEQHKLRLKIARAKVVMPKRDTKIEVKIQELLSELHIEFLTHKYISEITHAYQCDIFIPVQKGINQKTIIECDGCFWHCCPICKINIISRNKERNKLDSIRTKELMELGYRVIRLWEHEIKDMDSMEIKCILERDI